MYIREEEEEEEEEERERSGYLLDPSLFDGSLKPLAQSLQALGILKLHFSPALEEVLHL